MLRMHDHALLPTLQDSHVVSNYVTTIDNGRCEYFARESLMIIKLE